MNDAPIKSSDEFEGCNYIFTVSNTREDKDSRIDIEVGGVCISAIIDSGASVNIIYRHYIVGIIEEEKKSASKLGILHIDKFRNSESEIVQQITDTQAKLKAKYPECFEGLGKLKISS